MTNIPVLHVQEKTLASAYEKALTELYTQGIRIKTQYDQPGEPASIDSTMNITVEEPWTDPMIHKAFPGGIEDLREYVFELLGRKDHWVKNFNDKDDTRWEYTYHGRIASWGTWYERDEEKNRVQCCLKSTGEACSGIGVDQIQKVIEKLCTQPYTRQAQMITWIPSMDFDVYDPPCLQSIWYRLVESRDAYYLNCNVRFRSNDAWGANFMNMFGFTFFNRELIERPLAEKLDKPIKTGRLNWHADSYHLYGKDQQVFKERFWDRRDTTEFADRVYNFHDEMIREIWQEAEETVLQKIEAYEQEKNMTIS